MSSISSIKTVVLSSLWKALLATLLFLLLGVFQGQNFVREKAEDLGFDAINKILSTSKQQIDDSVVNKVSVFVFDNDYMRQHGLYDDDGVSTFGSTFPRGHIAGFLESLDQHLLKLKQLTGGQTYCPKAVFIDIDTSYSSGADNTLSLGDEALIKTLSKPTRCYKVLLARGSKYNFIESAALDNPQLKERFNSENPSIIFVSPNFHEGNDNVIRRNEPIKIINDIPYPSASIALWQLSKNDHIDLTQVQRFINDVDQAESDKQVPQKPHRVNVNANRIWIRHYRLLSEDSQNENICGESSYWENLKKFSLSCAFTHLTPGPDYLDDTVLLLGSTEKENSNEGLGRSDYHKVLNLFIDDEMSGVDIHANSVMTLLHLDSSNSEPGTLPQLMQLSWYKSLPAVFGTVLFISLFSTWLLSVFNIKNDQISFFTSAAVSTVIFFILSFLLIKSSSPVWFNWVFGAILFQSVEVVLVLREYLRTIWARLDVFFNTEKNSGL